ncbi:hypothetical protein JG688_00007890 [Phytophthora aleatoria]|uniref:Uncharacterized protein n=1 Tax=Phytophthora aleatoria TaxID=2496075 RepID=A0A8J5IIU6_9STRA|nr:hypothetical protein JG688_00007890 [Phytophthora aleatoria]
MAGFGLVEGRSRPLPELCGNLPAHFWRQKRSAPPEIGLDKRQQANLRARERAANAFPSAGESSFVMTHVDGRATSRPMLEPATRPKASLPRTCRLVVEARRPQRSQVSVDTRIFRRSLEVARIGATMAPTASRWRSLTHMG